MIKSNALYNALKFIAQVLLPALGTFYFALAGIWDLPSAEQVVGTIVVVDTFLGTVLHISTSQYNKSDAKFDGKMVVNETEKGKIFNLELNGDPEYDLEGKDEILFKVEKTKTGGGANANP